MTFSKWVQMYNHYKDNYDFQLRQVSYAQLQQQADEDAIGQELPG